MCYFKGVLREQLSNLSGSETPLANDRVLGGGILAASILGIVLYGVLLFYFSLFMLELTAMLAVLVLLGILAWIGWTMATTHPPEPMPDMTAPKASAPASEQKPSTKA